MNKLTIYNNNTVVVSSRIIANELNKRHDHIIRDLEKILATPNLGALIIPSDYKDKQGKTRKEYLLTKDGFTLYMFNIQGYNDFKMAYINKFNEMQQQLQQPALPTKQEQPQRLYYKGQPVMTVKMFVELTGVYDNLVWAFLSNFDNNNLLTGAELKEFKKENPHQYNFAKSIRIITYDMAKTMLKFFNKKLDLSGYFELALPQLPENDLTLAEEVRILKELTKDMLEAIGLSRTTDNPIYLPYRCKRKVEQLKLL